MKADKLAIAIVGGGISGLSAAWELQINYPEQSYILFESSSRWGGKVITAHSSEPYAIMDGGPESFVTRKSEVWDLAHELQLEEQIIVPASETRGMNVLHDGKIYSIPLHPIKFIKSNLLSWRGKLRLLAEPFISARRDTEDETLANFVRRRLGKEVLEKLIGPVLGGIYNADPDKQSIMYTSPIMREMEAKHGSLFRGSFARMRGKKNPETESKPSFIAFKGGTQTLIDALLENLSGDLRLNSPVQHIEIIDNHYRITMNNGDSVLVAGIIFATPSDVSAKILATLSPDASSLLRTIHQSSLGTMSLLYRSADLPANGIKGLMIPRSEKRMIDAIQFTSERMPHRTDKDHTLIRVFFGGANPEMVAFDDKERLQHIRSELQDLLNIHLVPISYQSFCWQGSYPQADVGHLEKISEIETLLPETIALAGASYRGLGVPDCIRQGRNVAKQIVKKIASTEIPESIVI